MKGRRDDLSQKKKKFEKKKKKNSKERKKEEWLTGDIGACHAASITQRKRGNLL